MLSAPLILMKVFQKLLTESLEKLRRDLGWVMINNSTSNFSVRAILSKREHQISQYVLGYYRREWVNPLMPVAAQIRPEIIFLAKE